MTWFLCLKHAYAISVIHQLIELSDDDIMRVQCARKWCREFENVQADSHNNDQAGWPSLSVMDVRWHEWSGGAVFGSLKQLLGRVAYVTIGNVKMAVPEWLWK